MSVEWSPGRVLRISAVEVFVSEWLRGGISRLEGCRRGRPRFLFKGVEETGMLQAGVRILLELQRLEGV